MTLRRDDLLANLVKNQYSRNDAILERCNFRARGETVDLWPAYLETALRITFFGDTLESIRELDPLSVRPGAHLEHFDLYPANAHITSPESLPPAILSIKAELEDRVAVFEREGRLVEAQRIRMRTEHDLEMMRETGFCQGVENYSMHIGGRKPGERPFCLLDFFPDDKLVFIDESHVSVPQIGGMYLGDRSRKQRLVDFGFRLPSAMENRPLRPEEFDALAGQTVYVSATPAPHEYKVSAVVAEQIIRPTGLLDPVMEVRPIKGQVEDAIGEVKFEIANGRRTLVTTLTKRMSEEISDYLREQGIKVEYLHSDIDAIERVEILRRLRQGTCDVLVGVNLLREGLDLPEVALVVILDADKEGFLRSETSIIQTAGRAARHIEGRVILYADVMTKSLTRAMTISGDRRKKQDAYNKKHGITPKSVQRPIEDSLVVKDDAATNITMLKGDQDLQAVLSDLETEMLAASDRYEFERAAHLRDQIATLRGEKPASVGRSKRRRGGR
jgi:excinuclease ABC subunit B